LMEWRNWPQRLSDGWQNDMADGGTRWQMAERVGY
jgi:hypothetical protein